MEEHFGAEERAAGEVKSLGRHLRDHREERFKEHLRGQEANKRCCGSPSEQGRKKRLGKHLRNKAGRKGGWRNS